MVAFLSILLAVVLLGITVYGLHRYQTMEVEYTVDRSMPLPPLDSQSDNTAKPQSPHHSAAPADNSKSKPAKAQQSWLSQVAELKKSGDLDEALLLCEQEFPLWGAYNQACIIERLKIKDESASADVLEAGLQRLYHLAVTAELLHDKSDDSEHLTLNQLKSLDLDKVNNLSHNYDEIGYAHLRLVRKSDIKVMQAQWGRPSRHTLPRDQHRQWWLDLIAELS